MSRSFTFLVNPASGGGAAPAAVVPVARALREARSSAGLNHPHVVTVFDVVEEAGHLWLVMELVPGRSLSQIIKQDGPLEPAVVADLGAQVADGLAALHAEGTVHRDVKPGNVLVRHDGVAKISKYRWAILSLRQQRRLDRLAATLGRADGLFVGLYHEPLARHFSNVLPHNTLYLLDDGTDTFTINDLRKQAHASVKPRLSRMHLLNRLLNI